MKDGIELSSKVWMPKITNKKRLPAIIEYIPYRKRDGTIFRDELIHPYFANNGYIAIRIDMRGSGDSDGVMHDEYTFQEQDDAITAIKWIANQDWCNGNIGMIGKSWGGFNSLQIASLAPKNLKTIVTAYTSVNRFTDDIHFKGGCLLGDNFRWGAVMLAYSSRPPDPMIVGKNWKKMWLERLKVNTLLSIKWIGHQKYNNYWKHGSVSEDYSSLKIPILAIAGWADNYMNAPMQLLKNVENNIKVIIGPWGHQYPHMSVPGPQINFLEEVKNWWDQWLKNKNQKTSNLPDYRFWLQDTVKPKRYYKNRLGRWQIIKKYPGKRIEEKSFYLSNKFLLQERYEKVNLTFSSPASCGLSVGEFFPMSIISSHKENNNNSPELSGDQREDDTMSLCFDSNKLKSSFSIVGRVKLQLKLRVNKIKSQIIVRLCEINPDGSSTKLSHGMLNLNFREGFEKPKKINKGEIININLYLDEVACKISKGNKIRVSISNNYWPYVWPSPELSELNLLYGKVTFPKFKSTSKDEYNFKERENLEGWKFKQHRKSTYDRIVIKDLKSNLIKLKIVTDNGKTEDLNHGLITDSKVEENWSIHPKQPLAAKATIDWVQIMQRKNWKVKILSGSTMFSDQKYFYFEGYVRAEEKNQIIYKRSFKEKVKRKYV